MIVQIPIHQSMRSSLLVPKDQNSSLNEQKEDQTDERQFVPSWLSTEYEEYISAKPITADLEHKTNTDAVIGSETFITSMDVDQTPLEQMTSVEQLMHNIPISLLKCSMVLPVDITPIIRKLLLKKSTSTLLEQNLQLISDCLFYVCLQLFDRDSPNNLYDLIEYQSAINQLQTSNQFINLPKINSRCYTGLNITSKFDKNEIKNSVAVDNLNEQIRLSILDRLSVEWISIFHSTDTVFVNSVVDIIYQILIKWLNESKWLLMSCVYIRIKQIIQQLFHGNITDPNIKFTFAHSNFQSNDIASTTSNSLITLTNNQNLSLNHHHNNSNNYINVSYVPSLDKKLTCALSQRRKHKTDDINDDSRSNDWYNNNSDRRTNSHLNKQTLSSIPTSLSQSIDDNENNQTSLTPLPLSHLKDITSMKSSLNSVSTIPLSNLNLLNQSKIDNSELKLIPFQTRRRRYRFSNSELIKHYLLSRKKSSSLTSPSSLSYNNNLISNSLPLSIQSPLSSRFENSYINNFYISNSETHQITENIITEYKQLKKDEINDDKLFLKEYQVNCNELRKEHKKALETRKEFSRLLTLHYAPNE